MSQIGNYPDWIERMDKKQEKELLEIINLKAESELLNNYLRQNKLPFCIETCKLPFEPSTYSTAFIIRIVEMIKSGKLVLKDAKI